MKLCLSAIVLTVISSTGFSPKSNPKLTSTSDDYGRNPHMAHDSSLKNHFKNDFLIGTALNASEIEEKDPQAKYLIPAQFNSISPENIMKCEVIHPEWNVFHFGLADQYVAYGQKHHM